jgi:prolyl oligopeptidase
MGSVAGDAVRLSYPPARRDDSVVEAYHGVQIPDPYRW